MKNLAKKLKIEEYELLIKIENLNKRYNLKIKDFDKLNSCQYNIIRSLLDSDYLVNLLRSDSSDRKYDYTNSVDYYDIHRWITKHKLNGFSTSNVEHSLPSEITQRGTQLISSAMRACGYMSRVTQLKDGKQGRRWFKEEISFF